MISLLIFLFSRFIVVNFCLQVLMSSLNQILEYEGDDFEEVFMQTFRIGHCDVFGTFLTHDLKENGDKMPVTQENKHVRSDSCIIISTASNLNMNR